VVLRVYTEIPLSNYGRPGLHLQILFILLIGKVCIVQQVHWHFIEISAKEASLVNKILPVLPDALILEEYHVRSELDLGLCFGVCFETLLLSAQFILHLKLQCVFKASVFFIVSLSLETNTELIVLQQYFRDTCSSSFPLTAKCKIICEKCSL